jgi:ATP-dependent DNA helicase RecQ
MLCGSQAAKIKRWRLDSLSTFGLLADFKQTEVTQIIDALISLSLIKMVEVEKFRPTIHNSEDGREVMMGRSPLLDVLELEPSLLQKIERSYARNQRKRPPNPVVEEPGHDSAEVPQTRPTLTVSTHEAESGGGEGKPNHYWTWRLLTDGYQWNDCMAIRRASAAELLDHLLRAHEDGLHVTPNWFLSSESMDWLASQWSDHGDIRPLMEQLPEGITTQQAKLFAKCRAKSDKTQKSSA